MQNRTPIAREHRDPPPDFTPVPRKYRHDGWTPERQRAFIGALADTGSVTTAAGMVNMAQTNCYALRRAPGAESFRRAWDAALDFGTHRLKDVAFERAIHGYLAPVFSSGKLIGFQRKYNDALLMFCLRQYGGAGQGRESMTINYVSTRAEAGVAAGAVGGVTEGSAVGAVAGASTTTLRTVVSRNAHAGAARGAERDDDAAAVLEGFAGLELDEEAQAAIAQALLDQAERRREADAMLEAGGTHEQEARLHTLAEPFVPVEAKDMPWMLGALETPWPVESYDRLIPGEDHWSKAGADMPPELCATLDAIDAMAAERAAEVEAEVAQIAPLPPPPTAEVKKRRRRKSAD